VIPSVIKEVFVPGSITFLIVSLLAGVLLLFRRKDGGRAGRLWIVSLALGYWVLSTPITALALVGLLTPDIPPVMSKADAPAATAIVVLGSGMEVHRSHGGVYSAPTREGALRVLEAARVYHVLGGVPIIATGGKGSSQYSEAGLMAIQLEQLGVPADRIIREEQSTNTRDHATFVPPLLKTHGLGPFVLVTSQQHIARALGAFRKVGLDPVPSTPQAFVSRGGVLEDCLPSRVALALSESLIYDLIGRVYYKVRGWA
jgi:uncharacterized SAM-binding protein YcdF (DUF218 family)